MNYKCKSNEEIKAKNADPGQGLKLHYLLFGQ